jgi:hypothetical protein
VSGATRGDIGVGSEDRSILFAPCASSVPGGVGFSCWCHGGIGGDETSPSIHSSYPGAESLWVLHCAGSGSVAATQLHSVGTSSETSASLRHPHITVGASLRRKWLRSCNAAELVRLSRCNRDGSAASLHQKRQLGCFISLDHVVPSLVAGRAGLHNDCIG